MALKLTNYPASVVSWILSCIAGMERGGSTYQRSFQKSIDGNDWQCSVDNDGQRMKLSLFRNETERLQIENAHRLACEVVREASAFMGQMKEGLRRAQHEQHTRGVDDQVHIQADIDRLNKVLEEQAPIVLAAEVKRDELVKRLAEWQGYSIREIHFSEIESYYFNVDQGAASVEPLSPEDAFEVIVKAAQTDVSWKQRLMLALGGKAAERPLTMDEVLEGCRKFLAGPESEVFQFGLENVWPEEVDEGADLRIRMGSEAGDDTEGPDGHQPVAGDGSGDGGGALPLGQLGESAADAPQGLAQAGAEPVSDGDSESDARGSDALGRRVDEVLCKPDGRAGRNRQNASRSSKKR